MESNQRSTEPGACCEVSSRIECRVTEANQKNSAWGEGLVLKSGVKRGGRIGHSSMAASEYSVTVSYTLSRGGRRRERRETTKLLEA